MKGIILLGAPGSGKGTTAEKVRETGFVHVSTGDMLRSAIKNGTAVGTEAKSYMEKGELVPDDVILKLVDDRVSAGAADDSYMFDGFPRTEVQAELLEQVMQKNGGSITHVFFLDAPRDVLIKRLTGRRICRACGQNFHIYNLPPKVEGVCDQCGGEVYHRPDDQEATIINRLEVFNSQTEGLIAWYEKKGILHRIDSNRYVDEIVVDLEKILSN